MQPSRVAVPFLGWLFWLSCLVLVGLALAGFTTEEIYVSTHGGTASRELALGFPFSPYLLLQWKGAGPPDEISWRLTHWAVKPFSVSSLVICGGVCVLLGSRISWRRRRSAIIKK